MDNRHLSILSRFPDKNHLITLRMSEDPEFYALCQDYEICNQALRHWCESGETEAAARIDEYRTLIRELEEEIAAELKSAARR